MKIPIFKLDVNREFSSLNQVSTDENSLAVVSLRGPQLTWTGTRDVHFMLCIHGHAYLTVDNDGSIGMR